MMNISDRAKLVNNLLLNNIYFLMTMTISMRIHFPMMCMVQVKSHAHLAEHWLKDYLKLL